MPSTFEPIASYTVSISGTTPITFSSIPATYTDLKLVFTQISIPTNANSYMSMRFNGDTGANYSVQRMYTTGGTPGYQSSQNSSDISPGLAVWANSTVPLLMNIDIMSYASSAYKTCLVQLSQIATSSGWNAQTAHTWRSSSAINEITIFDTMSNGFGVGSSAVLYGIKAA